MRRALLLALLASGCWDFDQLKRRDLPADLTPGESVDATTAGDLPTVDAAGNLSTSDGGAPDLPDLIGLDAAPVDDLAAPDIAASFDAATVADLALPDLVPVPDLLREDGAIAVFPSHVPAHYLTDGTCDIHLAANPVDEDMLGDHFALDTSAQTLDGKPLPSGCKTGFEMVGGVEFLVIAVHTLSIEAGAALQVSGSRPLIIVAADTIEIGGKIELQARADVPGPGGAKPATGLGAGSAGASLSITAHGGGGGGGYSTEGGRGGAADDAGGNPSGGGAAGKAYGQGDPNLAVGLPGGSGGGAGAGPCNSSGGAGGGALQLTSKVSIVLGPGGVLDVGGGGGREGCLAGNKGSSGGGGGSGGSIYLEAPLVALSEPSAITANGGGGGAGADTGLVSTPGHDGSEFDSPTPGGTALGPPPADAGDPEPLGPSTVGAGAGGQGGALAGGAASGASAHFNGGGGGGAPGRILIRAHATPNTSDGTVSPPARILTDL